MSLRGASPEVSFEEDEATETGRIVHEILADVVNRKPEGIEAELEQYIGASARDVVASLVSRIEEAEEVETEKYFEIEVGDVVINGKIDLFIRRNGKVELYDYKTAWGLDEHRFKKQARVYLAAMFLQGEIPAEMYSWLVRWNIIKPAGVDPQRAVLWLRRRVKQVLDIVEGDEPYPAPGDDCAYCPFVLSCPVGQSTIIKNKEEAEEAVRELIKVEAKRKALIEKLKQWVKVQGNVVVEGKEYGLLPSESLEVDEEMLWEALTEEGKRLIYKPDLKALRKLSKSHPELVNFMHINIVPRWNWRGKKVDEAKDEKD